MSYHSDDTICAIATAAGGAARGMMRISGPDAIEVVAKVLRVHEDSRIEDLRLPTAIAGSACVTLHNDLDHTLPCDAYFWPTARSYTREPVVELHTLGSPPLLDALVAATCRAGARLAEPGEFTLRAFLAGRIDLTQAEAVLGVIEARSDDELTTALTQLAGGLARPLHQLRNDLLQLLAELEAGLDFVEEDIEFISQETLLARLNSANVQLADVERQMSSRGTATPTTQVAIAGPPNVGKSSLFNALVARFGLVDASAGSMSSPAIVSAQRGTTRDYLTATIEIDGARCELVDTAGVDIGQSERAFDIDVAAQSFATERRAAAAIRLHCIDAADETQRSLHLSRSWPADESRDIVVLTKSDLTQTPPLREGASDVAMVATSSRTGHGLDELCGRIRDLLRTGSTAQQSQSVASTADRCRESVRLAAAAIARASEIIVHQSGDELAAAELHTALSELGKVVGVVYTDDLLDRVFKTFCIGK